MSKVTKHPDSVNVTYQPSEITLLITLAEYDLILSSPEDKAKMIKFISSQYNLSLYDAKQLVDTVIASAEIKPEVQLQSSVAETEVDWSSIPEGTRILVRDFETEPWDMREFLYVDNLNRAGMPFICRNFCDHTSIVHWKYAKLSND